MVVQMGAKYFYEPLLLVYAVIAATMTGFMLFSFVYGIVEISIYGAEVSRYNSYTHGTCQVVGTQIFNKTCSKKICDSCAMEYYYCYSGVWYLAVIENSKQVAFGKTNTLTTNLENVIVNELNKHPNGSLNECWYETNNKANIGWDSPDYPNENKILGIIFLVLAFCIFICIPALFLCTVNWCYICKKINRRKNKLTNYEL